ncbi:MAG: CoA-binding protein [Dehalococcoidia bacterium]|nr:CoA-binding protein [Dehalococcoidia bacterium]MYK26747.1 CoA-binding protein [Dehalococcoidia bacterium]
MSNDPALDALLGAKTIAVVGLDTRTFRPAYEVAAYLQSQGYRIIPVPVQQPADEVLGEQAYASLRDIPEHVDLVDVFVRPDRTGPFVDDAIAIGAGAVWLQLGIRNEAAIERALAAGLVATQDRCTKVEHQRAQALGLR